MAMRPVLEFEGDAPQHAHNLVKQGDLFAAKLPESHTTLSVRGAKPAPVTAHLNSRPIST
jgi:hypothetical protein